MLNMNTTYMDWRNTNVEVHRRANLGVETRQGNDTRLTWSIRQCVEEKRTKLTGHLLRARDSDPMRQVTLAFRKTALPPTCLRFAGLVDHARIG